MRVSFNFPIATISPPRHGRSTCIFPEHGENRCPLAHAPVLVALYTVLSASNVPEYARTWDNRPTNGSMSVLNTQCRVRRTRFTLDQRCLPDGLAPCPMAPTGQRSIR